MKMAVEKYISVDFSTSTTVAKVKRYDENGTPLENGALPVVFNNMGQVVVPTLIRKIKDAYYFGYDARDQNARKSVLYQNFKPELESPDLDVREKAWENTEAFIKYLADTYREQNTKGFFGSADEHERTIISYPVKWSRETRGRLLETASKAGFHNVEGMDEAQAAIQAVLAQSPDMLIKQGYLKDGIPVNILLIDMGAGTTDLVLCRYTLGKTAKYEILSTYPKSGEINFGGSEIDVKLRDYISGFVPQEGKRVMQNVGVDAFKSWKETLVSPVLLDNGAADTCEVVNNYLSVLDLELETFKLDRKEFERICKDYLDGFPKLVCGCIEEAGLNGGDIDLVVTTGGHSQWYFVNEMLLDQLVGFAVMGLTKIRQDKNRLIAFPRPQETVALGLVYGPIVKAEQERIRHGQHGEKLTSLVSRECNASVQIPQNLDIINRYKKNGDAMMSARWHYDIVAVKVDGTIVKNTNNQSIQKWNEWNGIVSIAIYNNMYIGLKYNGQVVASPISGDPSDVENALSSACEKWTDIVALAKTDSYIVGLKKNGKVVFTGNDDNVQLDVNGWDNIISIACGDYHLVGLRKDGTVLATGGNTSGQCDVSGWNNIAAIACGRKHTLGLRKNGTVVAAGLNDHEQCNVNSWINVQAITCGGYHSVGLKSDGSICFAGKDEYGQSLVPNNTRIIAIAAMGNHTYYLTDKGYIMYNYYKYNTSEFLPNVFAVIKKGHLKIDEIWLETTKWSIFDK